MQAQELLNEAQCSMKADLDKVREDQSELKTEQGQLKWRLSLLESKQGDAAAKIETLQKTVDDMRDSAIRGEVASGVPSKVVAEKYNISPSRVTQIAPRRKYNNG